MAIAIQNVYSSISGSDQTISITVSAASGLFLVACVGIHQGSILDVQADGVSMTQGPTATTAFNERSEIWYKSNPATGTYNIWFDGTGGTGRSLVVYVLTGVSQSGQPAVTATNSGADSFSYTDITPLTDNNLIIDSHYSEGDFTTVGSNQTERANLQDQSYENAASSTSLQTTATLEEMGWSISSGQRWASVSISLEPLLGSTTQNNSTRSNSLTTYYCGYNYDWKLAGTDGAQNRGFNS